MLLPIYPFKRANGFHSYLSHLQACWAQWCSAACWSQALMLLQISILYALKPETVFVLALQLFLAKSSFISSRGLLLLE